MKKGFFAYLALLILLPSLLGAAQHNIQIARAHTTPPILSVATIKLIASYTPAATALTYMGSHYKELGQQPYRATATMQNIQWGCFAASMVIIVGYIIYLHRQLNKATRWINTIGSWNAGATAENTINFNAQRDGLGIEFTILNQRLLNLEGPSPKPIDPALAEMRKNAGQGYEEDPRAFIARSISSQQHFQAGDGRKNNDFDADIDERIAQYKEANNKKMTERVNQQ